MSTTEQRSLNKKQLDILRLLYRFRFATTQLLTQALGTKSKIKMNERLKVLLDRKCVGRNYDPEYHLLRKHATYYLLPEGIEALKQIPDNKFDSSALRNIRNDKTASGPFIDYCLAIFDIYCQLKARYGDRLQFFTKSQLAYRYDYFAEFVPSAYMRVVANDTENDYLLEIPQSSQPLFAAIKRLRQYIEYADSGEWEAGTDSDFPTILIVCDSDRLRDRLLKRIDGVLSEADDDLKFYVTTANKLDEWQDLTDEAKVARPLPAI